VQKISAEALDCESRRNELKNSIEIQFGPKLRELEIESSSESVDRALDKLETCRERRSALDAELKRLEKEVEVKKY
jgi:hypothetical protein